MQETQKKQQPDSDATSKETLKDLEEDKRDAGTESDVKGMPSPDGAMDEDWEVKDAGPI